ncbi:hypothetical protein ABT383_22835 [Streptomyces humidus]|uniref:hypothetical protein n=1 Tax=Streptomyces humidus TaxID=52259 RepID=UPI00167EFDFD|nr:hypothetical protein [Streptomyces humidus]
MSETPETSEVPERPERPEAAGAEAGAGHAVAEPAPAGARRTGRIAAVAGSVLLACAVVGGTVVTVRGADRGHGSPTWKFPETPAEGEDGADGKGPRKGAAAGSGLSALMVPFGTDGFQPGPDMREFGSDAEFSGAQATALRKESIKDLPSASRRKLEKLIDKEPVKGMAMRSYAVAWSDYNRKDTIVFDVTLSRLENPTAARRSATAFNGFLAAVDVFRKGPRIEGRPDARCSLSPKGEAEDLGVALCTAAVGDVLVSVSSAAPDPIDGTFVAKFFAAQLARIDDPGQAV